VGNGFLVAIYNGPKYPPETCKHKPEALYSWMAYGDTGKKDVLCVVCFACQTTLKGGC
jgi:hypothetical protein